MGIKNYFFFKKKMKLLASLGLTLVSAGTFPVRVPCSSLDSCQKICAASHKCKFWTFWAGKCWLKAQEGEINNFLLIKVGKWMKILMQFREISLEKQSGKEFLSAT